MNVFIGVLLNTNKWGHDFFVCICAEKQKYFRELRRGKNEA